MSRLPLGAIRAKSHWGLFEQLYGTHLRMIPLREAEAEELSPTAHPTLVKVVPGALALLCFHPALGATNRLSERESALCSAPGARAVSTYTGWSSGGSEDLARPWQPRPHLPIKIPPHSAPPSLPSLHLPSPTFISMLETRKTWQNICQTVSSGYFEGRYIGGNYRGF